MELPALDHINSDVTRNSSSIGTTAQYGLWPVGQSPIFSYLPPTFPIFSLPALEDLFSTSYFHLFLGLPLILVSFQFLSEDLYVILSSILSR